MTSESCVEPQVSGGDERPSRPVTGSGFVRKYLSGLFLLICLIVFSVFLGFSYKAGALAKEQLRRQGEAFFQEVVLTREWAANHGGVYVQMKPGVEVNPYLLAIPGVKAVIRDEQGVQYALRNPALMTREISEMAARKGIFRFRMTSLRPINAHNAPDAFEITALQRFEQRAAEHYGYEESGTETLYRYMAPLVTQTSCLQCHAAQGYHEGDIRGGISVTINATPMMQELRASRFYLLLSALGIVLAVFGSIRFISWAFAKDLRAAEQQLIDVASHDDLTGILNRREGLVRIAIEIARARRRGTALCVMIVDVDHFKRVNDTYGHAAGDAVLRQIAQTLVRTLRPYDIVCRYGGEEFLVCTPEASLVMGVPLAERVRAAVGALSVTVPSATNVKVTLSAGIAGLACDEDLEQVISRADSALLEAKASGRDRVVQAGTAPAIEPA